MAKRGNSGWIKWMVILIVLAAIVGGAVWFFKSRGAQETTYQTAGVARGEIIQAVTATGTINPMLNVQVGSQISGRIKMLYADFNSNVTSNQVIAEIDPSTYEANIQRAEADLANSMAALELAQVEARRAAQLYTNNLISGSDYDNSIASLHQSQASVKIKQAALDSATVDLSRCTIYSPVNGVVISRNVDVGQTVAASLSAPILFQIANDLTKMQIDANVAEADVGGVEEGQDVDFTVDAFPYRTFHGIVTQVRNSPNTVQNVVTYDAVISVTNADYKLKPGMTANVSIIVARREEALKIPNAALRFRPPEVSLPPVPTNTLAAVTPASSSGETNASAGQGERRGGGRRGQGGGAGGRGGGGGGRSRGDHPVMTMRTVYLLPAGPAAQAPDVKLKPTQIRIGISDGISTEVLSGLEDGDQVVTGSNSAQSDSSPGNPFGGGRGGGGFRRF